MPYPKKLLNDYESVALDLHPHWSFFAEPVLALLGSIVFGIVVIAATDVDALKYLAIALIVASAIWLIGRYAKWATTNFVITSDRVIFRSGIIAKSGIEIPLERVNSVLFHQSVFERMLGAGDLLIESGAENGQQRFTDIRSPDRVQNLIHSQMEVNEGRLHSAGSETRGTRAFPVAGDEPPPRSPGGNDVIEQLERLEAMVERGTLSPDDFEAQKRRLLDG